MAAAEHRAGRSDAGASNHNYHDVTQSKRSLCFRHVLPVLAALFPHDTQDSPHIAAEILAGHRSLTVQQSTGSRSQSELGEITCWADASGRPRPRSTFSLSIASNRIGQRTSPSPDQP